MPERRAPADPKPPVYLSKEAKAFWRETVSEFVLEPHHLRVLEAACTALDRMNAARKEIQDRGILVEDRFGVPKANPAVAVERDARTAFLRAVRNLDLDIEPPKDALPRLAGRR